jgi:hypothetical protein
MVQDGKKLLIDGRFEKGLIIAGPPGYIYAIFGLEISLAGLPEQARLMELDSQGLSPELANEDHFYICFSSTCLNFDNVVATTLFPYMLLGDLFTLESVSYVSSVVLRGKTLLDQCKKAYVDYLAHFRLLMRQPQKRMSCYEHRSLGLDACPDGAVLALGYTGGFLGM